MVKCSRRQFLCSAPRIQVEDITDFYKFTKDSFTAVDYKYHEFTDKIPVAI